MKTTGSWAKPFWTRLKDNTKVPRRWWYPLQPPCGQDSKSLIEQHAKCSETIRRTMLLMLSSTFLLLLTILATPDRLFVIQTEGSFKFQGAALSLQGFLIAASFIQIVQLVYLHIFYGYLHELEGRGAPQESRAPTLFNLDRRDARLATELIFYWLVPLVFFMLALKASVRPSWAILLYSISTATLLALNFVRIRRSPGPQRRGVKHRWVLFFVLFVSWPFVIYGDYLFRPLNFTSADLRDQDLSGLVLDRAIFTGAQMTGTNLSRSSLRGANLFKADLSQANLEGADLQDATLDFAPLQGASLDFARLQGASLDSAQLQGASLDSAQLQGASLDFAQLQRASLDRASLQGASLDFAQLQGASLDRASLQGATLDGAQLQGASLDGAQLQGASLDGAQLQGASLDGAQLQGASLESAQLQTASLDEVSLQGASLDFAQLQGASLDDTDLHAASLDDADLRGVSLDNATLRGSSLNNTFLWRAFGEPDPGGLEHVWVREPQLQALTSEELTELVERALTGVEPQELKQTIQETLTGLLAPEKKVRNSLPHKYWTNLVAATSTKAFQNHLADRLTELACGEENAPFVAQGLTRIDPFDGTAHIEAVGLTHLPRVAQTLLDAAEGKTSDCPGAEGLDTDSIAQLRKWATEPQPPDDVPRLSD